MDAEFVNVVVDKERTTEEWKRCIKKKEKEFELKTTLIELKGIEERLKFELKTT